MEAYEFFKIAHFLVDGKQGKLSKEILYRTAINHLYYGAFHFVQKQFKIFIPQSEITHCHAFVKIYIESTNIIGDYSDLEVYRVDSDYELSKNITINHYKDALRIQERILKRIAEPEQIPYDDDEKFFSKYKKS